MAEKGQKNTHTLKYNLRTCRPILPPDAQCEETVKNFILTREWVLLTKCKRDPCNTNRKRGRQHFTSANKFSS